MAKTVKRNGLVGKVKNVRSSPLVPRHQGTCNTIRFQIKVMIQM